MSEVQELKNHAMATKALKQKLSNINQSLNKQSEETAQMLAQLEERMQLSENETEINKCFSNSSNLREELLTILKRKETILKLLDRQQDRLDKISFEIDLNDIGEINKINYKVFSEIHAELSIENLGLSEQENQLKNFKGQLLKIKNTEIDLADLNNIEIIKNLGYDELSELIYHYPNLVNQISAKMLFNSKFRINFLKAIACYVFEELKTKTVSDVNSNLGNLLNFDYEIVNNFTDYMNGIINLFKVKIKSYLISINKEQSAEISKKLDCDETSKLLPPELHKNSADNNNVDDGKIDIDSEIDAFLADLNN